MNKHILTLFTFPVLYYFASMLYYDDPIKLFKIYLNFTTGEGHPAQYQWAMKGEYYHYLSAMVIASGIWMLVAFRNIIEDWRSWTSQAFLILLAFYIATYVLPVSSNVGNTRYILWLCPIIAYYVLEEK